MLMEPFRAMLGFLSVALRRRELGQIDVTQLLIELLLEAVRRRGCRRRRVAVALSASIILVRRGVHFRTV